MMQRHIIGKKLPLLSEIENDLLKNRAVAKAKRIIQRCDGNTDTNSLRQATKPEPVLPALLKKQQKAREKFDQKVLARHEVKVKKYKEKNNESNSKS